MNAISPELALVDEHLGRNARASLPGSTDCLVPSVRPATSRSTPLRRAGTRGYLVSTALAALAVIALLARATPDTSSGSAPAASATATAASHDTRSGPLAEIRWNPDPRARLYNVVFWSNGKRALDLWPETASARVPRDRLAPGLYQWFVYPWLDDIGPPRFGRVVAHGTIKA